LIINHVCFEQFLFFISSHFQHFKDTPLF